MQTWKWIIKQMCWLVHGVPLVLGYFWGDWALWNLWSKGNDLILIMQRKGKNNFHVLSEKFRGQEASRWTEPRGFHFPFIASTHIWQRRRSSARSLRNDLGVSDPNCEALHLHRGITIVNNHSYYFWISNRTCTLVSGASNSSSIHRFN